MEYNYNALETAKAAMRFINTRKRQAPEGIYFSLEDGETGHASYYDEICLYAGASGILCFLLGLYDATSETEYLEEAKEVARYLQYRWNHQRTLKRNFSQYAFSSGWSGAGFALLQLYQVTGEQTYADTVNSIVEQAIRDARAGEIPAVFHRKNRKEWKVTLRLDDFMKLYAAAEEKRKSDAEQDIERKHLLQRQHQ